MYRYTLVGSAEPKDFSLGSNDQIKHITSSEKYLVAGLDKYLKKVDIASEKINEANIGFRDPASNIADLKITNNQKYSIAVSRTTSEVMVVDNEHWKYCGGTTHVLDHTVKLLVIDKQNYILYNSHADIQHCILQDTKPLKTDRRILPEEQQTPSVTSQCHSIKISLKSELVNKVETKIKISSVFNPENTDFLIILSSNVNKLYVINIKSHLTSIASLNKEIIPVLQTVNLPENY